MIRSEYLRTALTPHWRKTTINRVARLAKKLLETHNLESIVVTGWSGALIGIPVADKLGIPLTIVRKDEDSSHSSDAVEGYVNKDAAVLLIDDMVCTGDTFRRAVNYLQHHSGDEYMTVGAFIIYDAYSCSNLKEIKQMTKMPLANPNGGSPNVTRHGGSIAVSWDAFKRSQHGNSESNP